MDEEMRHEPGAANVGRRELYSRVIRGFAFGLAAGFIVALIYLYLR